MRSGSQRHQITIQTPVKTKSATGAVVVTWTTFVSLWASIETLRSYERQSANASWPGSDTKISFRWIDGVLPTMRILYNGKVYSILGINNVDERNRELELLCQSGVKAS